MNKTLTAQYLVVATIKKFCILFWIAILRVILSGEFQYTFIDIIFEDKIMGITLIKKEKTQDLPLQLLNVLPILLVDEVLSIINTDTDITLEEIRLRKGVPSSLSTNKGTIVLNSVMTQAQMNDILVAMSGRSLYAHTDTISQGYITLDGGIRVGICGRARVFDGKIRGICDVSALNIRLPTQIKGVGEQICRLLRSRIDKKGVLIYSPPGVGKTTLLRSVAYKMATEGRSKRVAVIDTRGELGIMLDGSRATIDVLSGYPKAIGIEIAARTMNPELMVCDEIGGEDEARAIIAVQNCGVPLLASAHGSDLHGLLKRTGILALHKAGVFGAYVRIDREYDRTEYKYKVNTAKEADRYL